MQGSHILPNAIRFAHKHQLIYVDLALAFELSPSFPGQDGGRARLFVQFSLYDRKVRDVGPIFLAAQLPSAELIVKFAHAIRRARHLDEYRGSDRKKGLHVAEFHIEGDDVVAGFFQKFDGGAFVATQFARRKDGEMSWHVGHGGMKLPAQLLDEFPHWIPNVRHQRVA